RKILAHVGEPVEPPPVSPAREPPTEWNELVQAHDELDVVQASSAFGARDRHPLALTRPQRGKAGTACARREKPASYNGC
ncbi:MAG: hypothetical protein WD060_13045, partial [Pirellulales bacterium]